MNLGKTLFAQVMDFLPWKTFHRIVQAPQRAGSAQPRPLPRGFHVQLTAAEDTALRSQIATSNTGRGGRRYFPYAFTGHGAIQAANVLNSPRAVEMGDLCRARLRAAARVPELEQGSRPAPRSARSTHRDEARHPR